MSTELLIGLLSGGLVFTVVCFLIVAYPRQSKNKRSRHSSSGDEGTIIASIMSSDSDGGGDGGGGD